MSTNKNWQGMNRFTGQSISESQHISQSIQDILTTPLGSRVMRRNYGSAIFRWEPRIRITEIEIISGGSDGKVQFNLVTDRIDTQRAQSFEVIYG